jgi:adenylate cyclase
MLKPKSNTYSPLRYSLLLAIPFLWCLSGHLGHLQFLENRSLDLRFRTRGELEAPPKIVYVDIDNEAIQAYRWPWLHSYNAELLDALFDHGKVKAVAFDLVFSENARPDFGRKEQDEARLLFGKSIHRHKNVVLAANYVPGPGLLQKKRQFPWVFEGGADPQKNDTPELAAFPILGPSWGIPGLIDTYMGEARFAPVFADTPVGEFHTMALRLALIHWGLTDEALTRFDDRIEVRKPDQSLVATIPLQRGQLVEVNWFSRWISPENLRCSVADIGLNLSLLEDADPGHQAIGREFFGQFRDAIVLVGPVDPLLQDLGVTPMDKWPVPRVGLHGNLLKTFVSGKHIRRLPEWADHLLTFLLSVSVVSLALVQHRDAGGFKVFALLLVALYVGVAFWIFMSNHVVLPLTAPLGATLMAGTFALGWQLVDEQRNKSRIKSMFGTYVSPQLVEQMVRTGESPQLGGVEEEITAYFSDIQGFSGFSELLPPDKLVELMNEYLTACTEVLLDQGGALDKYIGDAVVAMFGGLVKMDDHAYRACVTSQLVQLRMAELREKWQSEGDEWPSVVGRMESRIGLNTGEVIVGNMGSPARFNFTMMGDNVNLAARMESGAKAYGVLSMATEATYRDCLKHGGDHVVFRKLDRIIVKGRTRPVSVFEIVGLKEHVPDRIHECIAAFEDGLARYQAMDWDGAERLFRRSAILEARQPDGERATLSNPSLVMIERCLKLRTNPPGPDWDGVYVMGSK